MKISLWTPHHKPMIFFNNVAKIAMENENNVRKMCDIVIKRGKNTKKLLKNTTTLS